jgi:soluble epoxide hydrolase/lipid-phosphate phosphatase
MADSDQPWKHRFVETNGIRMHFVEQGEGFPVVLCHGFPELWYSWRHQIPTLANAGLRAIAPDLRGYGETDKPHAIRAYDIHHLIGDLTGLLDALDLPKAVIVGHDWGGIIVWFVALMAPDRVERVVSLNTPYWPRPPVPPTEVFRQLPDGRFNYILQFQPEGEAEAILEPDIEASLRRIFRSVAGDPDFIADDEFAVFVEAFRAGGLRGPINLYRNFDHNWETTPQLDGAKVMQPALMVCAEKDPVLPPSATDGMGQWVPNLRRELIHDCGHWTQQEKPDEVNRLLLDFLADLRR